MNGKQLVLIITTLFLLTGCNIVQSEKDHHLFSSITELQHHVEEEAWTDALLNIQAFQKEYEQRKWKLQLLGALDDYKEIELEIASLKESLKGEEELESKISLSHIKHRLQLIYNL
ncbi:DUF4363 family protein [Halalkalibacter urbisdiaboli]|uniref:DUF4363 family protein n=1 Tax=Halalkalibacter urbisdiaboli TaxID=1960589 RepID=UPI000B433151|nr:DUF4363 family protein [Halalkalibacter urbisdiaboli]